MSATARTGTLTIHRTYGCGHSVTVTFGRQRADATEEQQFPAQVCDACRAAGVVLDLPLWQRAGYPDEDTYRAAVEHYHAVRQAEADRKARGTALAAMPEAERPFTTRAPLSGFPTLDEVAHDDFED